jgi:pectinacetylesterase
MKLAWLGLAVAVVAVGCGSSSSGGSSAAPGGDASASDASSCGEGGCAVTGLTVSQWTWVDVPGAVCRNGTGTGFAVSPGTAADKLMVFLEGGGACFNELTCLTTPEAFTSTNGKDWAQGTYTLATASDAGLFDRTDPANPVKDWNFVYIPYCTGDIHAGNNPSGTVSGVTGTQHFVGYHNVGLDLQHIVPTFPGLTQVLLTGISAGGFGAAANYVQVSNAFGSTPVTLLDDSGPAMEAPYFATCLATLTTNLWNLNATALADCGSDCSSDPSQVFLQYALHLGKAYPDRQLALVESTDDGVITEFFGFGADNCTGDTQLTATQFTDGLIDLRQQLASESNWGSYFFQGTQHTSLGGDSTFDGNTTPDVNTLSGFGDAGLDDASIPSEPDAGTIALTAWVTNLIAGHVSNVGP